MSTDQDLLRDYFAASATASDVENFIPDTVGDCHKLCGMLGIDTVGESNWRAQLRVWARYQHADAMLRERNRAAALDAADEK